MAQPPWHESDAKNPGTLLQSAQGQIFNRQTEGILKLNIQPATPAVKTAHRLFFPDQNALAVNRLKDRFGFSESVARLIAILAGIGGVH
jgi:hypothetical protein